MALTSLIRKMPRAALAVVAFLVLAGINQACASLLDSDIARNLQPHRAVYNIKMVKRHDGAQVQNISGQMTYEWKRDCDAWVTNHHFKLAYEYPGSPVLNIVSDFSTYEPFDGQSLSFTSRRAREGDLYEELRGNASFGHDGTGRALYNMPPELKFNLSKGTLFPMMHTLALLDNIEKGKKFFHAVVFDGSDDEGPVEINAIAGGRVSALDTVPSSSKIDSSLLKGPAWNVRLAFFPVQGTEAVSDYEMSAVLHRNGIISDMRVDYKDFSVTQKLVALERLKNTACGRAIDTPLNSH